jgi:hypothetical protein
MRTIRTSSFFIRHLLEHSVQRAGIEARRSPADLDEVAKDPAYLRGISDKRDELHLLATPAIVLAADSCSTAGSINSDSIVEVNFRVDVCAYRDEIVRTLRLNAMASKEEDAEFCLS